MITIKKFAVNFTQVPNGVIYDSRISLKAKGLYVYLFSKPDGWEFHLSVMQSEMKEGKDSIYNGIKELVDAGYIIRRQINNGKFGGTVYEFTQPENPCTENPCTENPHTENPDTNNTNISNTDLNNTEFKILKEKEINKEKEKYAFEGKVIRLKQADFDKWSELYPNLNLRGELYVRDLWLAEQPLTVQKKWFVSTSQYFVGRDAFRKKQNADEEETQQPDDWGTL